MASIFSFTRLSMLSILIHFDMSNSCLFLSSFYFHRFFEIFFPLHFHLRLHQIHPFFLFSLSLVIFITSDSKKEKTKKTFLCCFLFDLHIFSVTYVCVSDFFLYFFFVSCRCCASAIWLFGYIYTFLLVRCSVCAYILG